MLFEALQNSEIEQLLLFLFDLGECVSQLELGGSHAF